MIFQQLIIENFRQFSGKQVLNFATNPQTNVTVIHGFNGSGKTTLLNVFIWLLYGVFSPDFENPEDLVTEAVFAQLKPKQNMVTSAKLIFKDKGLDYTAERKIVIGKDDTGKRCIHRPAELTLKYIDETGEIKERGNPQDSLEQILPKSLYPFFFFNGERIEKLASTEADEQIESGVKVLLDIEVFDRAIAHLDPNGKVAKDLRDEIARNAGEDGLKANQERNHIEQQKQEVEEELAQMRLNLKAFYEEKEKIDTKLSEMPELAIWLTERKAKEKELESTKEQLRENRRKLAQQLSQHGYLVLVPEVLAKAKEILESAHQKGELPIPMKRQFVSELLEKGECICGRDLIEGQNFYKCVREWRDRVGSEELEGAVSVTKAKLESLFQRRETAILEIAKIQTKQGELHQDIRRLQEELDELSSQIGNREYGEDRVKLEAQRKKLETEITNLSIEINDKEKLIRELEAQLEEKDREIKKLDKVDKRGKLAQQRLEAISNVKSAIEKIRKLRHQQLSQDLSQRLGEVWSRIAIKDYQAKLDEQYHLCLTKNVAGVEKPVGASTGEKQVLSLAFIGSLVDKARSIYDEKVDRNQSILFKGGLYSLVIDAPFGQLESEYKRELAVWIPTLAPQVIFLVPDSQWKKEVEEELQSRIGSEWILQCFTTKEGTKTKTITLRGREYPYVVKSNHEFEQTQIVEVEL